MDLPRSRRIDPVRQSPRSMMYGSFTHGTFHLPALAHLAFCLSPTVFAGRLPRPTPSPIARSRGFRRASGTTQPSDYSQSIARHFACAYRSASPGATRRPCQSSWGHALIFRTVPSANTLVRWVNERWQSSSPPRRASQVPRLICPPAPSTTTPGRSGRCPRPLLHVRFQASSTEVSWPPAISS